MQWKRKTESKTMMAVYFSIYSDCNKKIIFLCSWLYCMFQERMHSRKKLNKKNQPNSKEWFFVCVRGFTTFSFFGAAWNVHHILILPPYFLVDFPVNRCFNFERKSYKAGRPKESKWIEWRNWEWEMGKARAANQPKS